MESARKMTRRGPWMKPRIAILAATLVLLVGAPDGIAQNGTTAVPATQDVLMDEGASIYRHRCARCHGSNGEGQRQGHDAAPRLSGTFAPLSVGEIAVQVMRGGSYMPPFDGLTDREIASVATYVRNSFGNNLGIAAERDVAGYRR